MKTITFLFVILASVTSLAQTGSAPDRKHNNQAWLIRNNVERLTARVIEGCSSDYEKVEAIHAWLGWNIKYDIEKAVLHDYRRVSTRNILWRRKAICLGYVDLFDAMCAAADIPSFGISGYAKNIDVDIVDSFYLDEHAWNAVKLDGSWYLIDNTWDAGHIRWYKQTAVSKLASIMQLPYRSYVYDPKFINAPHTTYFLRSGEFFRYDHLASNPDHQMMHRKISMKAFQNDSAYYYKKHANPESFSGFKSSAVNHYFALSKQERLYANGSQSVRHNYRNHYLASVAHLHKAQNVYAAAQKARSKRLADYENAYVLSTVSLEHSDSNHLLLRQQRESLLRNNKYKRTLQKERNKAYRRYLKRYTRVDLPELRKLRNLQKKGKRDADSERERLERVLERNDFAEKEYKHKFEQASDSVRQVFLVDSLETAFSLHFDSLKRNLDAFDDLVSECDDRFAKELNYMASVRKLFFDLSELRIAGFDDLDHEVIARIHQFHALNPVDSFLYFSRELRQIDSVRNYYRQTHWHISQLHKVFSRFNKEMKGMKRMMAREEGLTDRWNGVFDRYVASMKRSEEWHKAFNRWVRKQAIAYKQVRKAARKAELSLTVEYSIYKPSEEIKDHHKALSKANKQVRRVASRLQRKSALQLQKLEE